MNNLFKIKVLVIIFATLCGYSANSQSIRLERTDVDSTRQSFVTATYIFAVDVVIDELENCNNATFRLRFDNSSYIKFSGASLVDYGEEGTLFTKVNTLNTGNEVVLDIGVFSGQPLQENEFDNPTIVNLEFVVLPNAPDDEIVNFNFENAFGGTFVEGEGLSVPLESEETSYDIHGFVDVWPGDTDQDGDVDNLDWQLYVDLFFSERFPGYRSFKREKASTLWKPQRALVWDVEAATYGDCDGDGEITVSDGLVVLLNLNEGRTGFSPVNYSPFDTKKEEKANIEHTLQNAYIKVPINANDIDYYGLLGSLRLKDEHINKFVGIEIGELFESNSEIIYDVKDNSLEFVIGDFDPDFNVEEKGTVAYLLFEKGTGISNNDFDIKQLLGLRRNKSMVDLQLINSVDSHISNYSINDSKHSIIINSEVQINHIAVYDVNGKALFDKNISNKYFAINKSELPNGFLILKIDNQSFPIINR